MNQKQIMLTFGEKISGRRGMEFIKSAIEIKINRLVIAIDSGTILSDLASLQHPGITAKIEPLISSVLAVFQFTDLPRTNLFLRMISQDFVEQQTVAIKYKGLIMIAIHQSQGQSAEFVKLVMLIIFAQYVSRYGMTVIEQFANNEKQAHNSNEKVPIDIETALLQFRLFQELSLDALVHEVYTKANPLYYSKDLQNLTKDLSTLTEILNSEAEKLYQVLKGKLTDQSQPFIFPEHEINLILAPRLINSTQIPLWLFGDEKISVNCIFKIRRSYQKLLRRSDLSSILSSQCYVRLFRNDENLKTFPFKEIDIDVQQYAQHVYMSMNAPIAQVKEWLEKLKPTVVAKIEQLKPHKEEEKAENLQRDDNKIKLEIIVNERRSSSPLRNIRHARSHENINSVNKSSDSKDNKQLNTLENQGQQQTPAEAKIVSAIEDKGKISMKKRNKEAKIPEQSSKVETPVRAPPEIVQEQRGGRIGPINKVLQAVKSTNGDQQEDMKLSRVDEKDSPELDIIIEKKEDKNLNEEKKAVVESEGSGPNNANPTEVPLANISSIDIKIDEGEMSGLSFNQHNEAEANNPKESTQRLNPDKFLHDMSSISARSQDKSAFGGVPFPF